MRCPGRIVLVCLLLCRDGGAITIGSGIESADESNICVFGNGICLWARTEFINDQEAPVSCGLGISLCDGVDGVPNSRVSST